MTEAVNAGAEASVNDTALAGADATATVETPSSTPAETLDAELGAVWEKHHPPRDGTGKYAAKNGDAAEDGAAEGDGTDIAESTDHPAEAENGPGDPATDAPNSWSAEEKAIWAKVPPEARAIIARREADMHKAITRAGEDRKAFEPIRETLERNVDLLEYAHKKHGLTPDKVTAKLYDMERFLRTDPQAAIQNIARAYGVDLSGVTGGESATPENAQLAALQGEIHQLKSYLTNQQRQAHEASTADLARTIAEFSKDKPHYQECEDYIASIIPSVRAENPGLPIKEILALAYDAAIYANPKVRTRVLAEKQVSDEAVRAKAEAERVAAAKRAAGPNVKSSPGVKGNPKTMDDTLREQASKHYGRSAA